MSRARYIRWMEQTQPSRLSSSDRQPTAQTFADWLTALMRERGYALPPNGRGGVRRLAEQAGVSPSVISTLLRGENPNPQPESLRLIAAALRVPFGETLIRAGVLTPAELQDVQTVPVTDRPPITPEQAAEDLGFTDPTEVQLLTAYVNALRRQRPDERAG